MIDVLALAEAIVTKLKAGGLSATTDPGKAATQLAGKGCVLVQPLPVWNDATLCGEFTLTWELVALVANPGNAAAAKRLAEMVQLTAAVMPISGARPATYGLVEGQPTQPAYVMTLEE